MKKNFSSVQLLFDPHSNSFSSHIKKKVPMWSWPRRAASESVAHPFYSMQSLWVMFPVTKEVVLETAIRSPSKAVNSGKVINCRDAYHTSVLFWFI